jgi:hypothetical protein
MTMKNADELIDRYIQCHSQIHQTCFGKSGTAAGGWDDFNDITVIDAYLFRVVVLRPLGIDISYDKIFRVPITQILVEPKPELKVRLDVERPSAPQTHYWDAFDGAVERGDVRLSFIEFFEPPPI